jgi:hypothetical protein
MKLLSIANKNNQLIKGYVIFTNIKDISFEELERISSMKELLENPNDFKSLIDFSKIIGYPLTTKETKNILKKLNMRSLYVYDEPPILSDKGTLTKPQWEKYWFRYIHPKCLKCINKCKESSRVDIIKCPKYKEK